MYMLANLYSLRGVADRPAVFQDCLVRPQILQRDFMITGYQLQRFDCEIAEIH